MSAPKPPVAIPAIALCQQDAAAALGMSADHFREHVASDLRCVRSGRLKLYPVSELTRWAEKHAERVLDGRAA